MSLKNSKKKKSGEIQKFKIENSHENLHSLEYYIGDKVELNKQIFSSLKMKTIKNLAPEFLKNTSIEEIQMLCLEELLGISTKRLRSIINATECPSDTESSDSDVQNIEEHISLEEISSDSDTGTKKSKKKNAIKKSKIGEASKDGEKTFDENGTEISVLELLELQARARAIRSQLALEPIAKIEVDSDESENMIASKKTKKDNFLEPPKVKESKKKVVPTKIITKPQPVLNSKEKNDFAKNTESSANDKDGVKKRIKLKRNFRKHSEEKNEEENVEPKSSSAITNEYNKPAKEENLTIKPKEPPREKSPSPDVLPIIPSPEILCISDSSDNEENDKEGKNANNKSSSEADEDNNQSKESNELQKSRASDKSSGNSEGEYNDGEAENKTVEQRQRNSDEKLVSTNDAENIKNDGPALDVGKNGSDVKEISDNRLRKSESEKFERYENRETETSSNDEDEKRSEQSNTKKSQKSSEESEGSVNEDNSRMSTSKDLDANQNISKEEINSSEAKSDPNDCTDELKSNNQDENSNDSSQHQSKEKNFSNDYKSNDEKSENSQSDENEDISQQNESDDDKRLTSEKNYESNDPNEDVISLGGDGCDEDIELALEKNKSSEVKIKKIKKKKKKSSKYDLEDKNSPQNKKLLKNTGENIFEIDSSDEEPQKKNEEGEVSWGSRWLRSSKVSKVMATSKLGNRLRDKIRKSKKEESLNKQLELEEQQKKKIAEEKLKQAEAQSSKFQSNFEDGSIQQYKELGDLNRP